VTLPRGVVVAFVAALLALGAAGAFVARDTHDARGGNSSSSTHAAPSTPARVRAIDRIAASELPQQMRRDAALVRSDHETRAAALRWFRTAPLGVFIHYGPSSLLAAPTDSTWWAAVHAPGYPSLVRRFHPRVDAAVADWVRLARDAGASYIAFTVKHHDGYTLWHSPVAAWGQPSDADVLKALAPAARRAHLRLVLYYSTLDLHEPTYTSDPAAYLVLAQTQLRELLTGYGPVAGVWFDGTWDDKLSNAQLESLYALIHRLQPWALVTTNHHHLPLPGEDYQTFEAGFPGHPPKGWPQTPVSSLPHQAAIALGPTWFWDGHDVPRTPARLERLIAEAHASHTSLLVDIPPRPDGLYGPGVFAAVRQAGNASR
jgi:alpha-L-fucosidase